MYRRFAKILLVSLSATVLAMSSSVTVMADIEENTDNATLSTVEENSAENVELTIEIEENDEANIEETIEEETYKYNLGKEGYRDAEGFVWEDSSSTIIVGYKSNNGAVVVPSKTSAIKEWAFVPNYGSDSITSVDMTNCSKMKYIGKYAFDGNKSLVSVKLPELLEVIYEYAFYECDIREITLTKNLKYIGQYAFGYNENLEKVIVNATNIEQPAGAVQIFLYDKKINQIVFSDEMTYIPESMFSEAKLADNITITIPANVKSIGNSAFSSSNVGNVIFAEDSKLEKIGNFAFNQCEKLTEITLPESLKEIGMSAFKTSGLTSITIPENVEIIEKEAFFYCNNLTSIEINATNLRNPSSSASPGIFYGGDSFVNNIKIGEGVTSLPNYFLANIKFSDITVTIPKSVTTLGSYVFYNNKSVDGPGAVVFEGNSIKTISDYNFYNYRRPTFNSLTIPEGVEEIGRNCITSCEYLDEITFPNSLKRLNGASCTYLPALKDVYWGRNLEYTVATSVFNGCPADMIFHLKKGSTTDKTLADIINKGKAKVEYDPFSYTIVYNANGGTGKMANTEYCVTGKDVLLRDNSFTKADYDFNGWNTKPDGSGVAASKVDGKYYINYNALKENDSITLYAQWKGAIRKVTFDANDGTVAETSRYVACADKYSSVYDAAGEFISNTPLPIPTKPGAFFMGWYNDDGEQVFDDDRVSLTKDITLTAYWKSAPESVADPIANLDEEPQYAGTKVKLSTATNGALIYYTTNGNAPVVEDATKDEEHNTSHTYLYEDAITITGAPGEYFRIRAVAYKEGTSSNDKLYVYQIKAEEDSWGTITEEDQVLLANDASNIPNTFWVVSYSYDSIEPAVPKAQIWEKNQTDETALVARETGEGVILPEIRVYYKNTLLQEGKDYSVKYTNNVKVARYNAINSKGASIAPTVTITGKGSYASSIVRRFTIVSASGAASVRRITSSGVILTYSLDGGKTYSDKLMASYEAKPIVPMVKVTLKQDGTELTEGKDYTVRFSNNRLASNKASITITGIDKYYGSIVKKFTISPKNIKGLSSSDIIIKYKDEDPSTEGYQVIYSKKNQILNMIDEVTVKDVEPIEINKDYKASYKYDKATNKYIITVTGKGNYTGTYSEEANIQIIEKTISDADIAYSNEILLVNNKTGIYNQKITVKDSEGNALKDKSEYNLVYKYKSATTVNNKTFGSVNRKAGDIVDKNDYLPAEAVIIAEITGNTAKNYTGVRQVEFKYISQYKFDDEYIDATVSDVVWNNKGGICKPSIVLVNKLTKKKLSAGRDFEKFTETKTEYNNYTYAEETYVTQVVNKKNVLIKRNAGDTVRKADIVPVGAHINATFRGKGSYSTDVKVYDFYYTYNIAKATVTVAPQEYGGKPVCPDKSAITITYKNGKDVVTIPKTSYEIVAYEKNNSLGNAKIKIRGLGNYGGVKTVSFKIVKKTICEYD